MTCQKSHRYRRLAKFLSFYVRRRGCIPTPIIARNLKVLAEVMRLGTVEVNGMQHATGRGLMLVGEPGTAKSLLSELLATAIMHASGRRNTALRPPERRAGQHALASAEKTGG